MNEDSRISTEVFVLDQWKIDPKTCVIASIKKGGELSKVAPRTMDVLLLLAERPSEVVSSQEFVDAFWPNNYDSTNGVQKCIAELRRAFGEDSKEPRLIETIPKRGYRLLAQPSIERTRDSERKSRIRTPLAVMGCLLLVALVGLYIFPSTKLITSQSPKELAIAVLPLEDLSGDVQLEHIGVGVVEELIHQLSQIPEVRVPARSSSSVFRDSDLPPEEIARDLNVNHLLVGSMRASRENLRFTLQLIDPMIGEPLWSKQFDGNSNDLFQIQDQIATEVLTALKISSVQRVRKVASITDVSAYTEYLRANVLLQRATQTDLEEAASRLDRALEKEPAFGLAYATYCYVEVGKAENLVVPSKVGFEAAREFAKASLEIRPNAEAFSCLQYVQRTWDWDWASALETSERGIVLDPLNPLVLQSHATLLRTLARWDEALANIEAALHRNPVDRWSIYNLGAIYYYSGHYGKSEAVFKELLELEPKFMWTRPMLARAIVAQDRAKEAIRFVNEIENDALRETTLPFVLFAANRHAEALTAHENALKHSEFSPYAISVNLAYMGRKDEALDWLDRAHQQRDPILAEMVGDPLIASLHREPRFESIRNRMNLPAWY